MSSLTPEQIAQLAQLALIERQLDQAITIKGEPGRDGADGKHGRDGRDGIDGQRGEQGPQGPRGEKGDPGPRGEKGDQGPRGPAGSNGADGKPGRNGTDGAPGSLISTWRGTWTKGTQYKRGDAVAHLGSSYLALQDTYRQPTDTTAWDILAQRGTDGRSVMVSGGASGPTNAATLYTATLAFGYPAAQAKTFTIANAAATVGCKVVAQISGNTPAGTDFDEYELDTFQIIGRCTTAGQITMLAVATNAQSRIGGTHNINYTLG